jgi:hypothetical protein
MTDPNFLTYEDGEVVDPNNFLQYREYETYDNLLVQARAWGSAEAPRICWCKGVNKFYYWNGTQLVEFPSAGGSGAPATASYVTISDEPSLTQETLHSAITGANLHICQLHAATHLHDGTDPLNVHGLSGVLADAQNADHLDGIDVSSFGILNGRVLTYDGATAKWMAKDAAGGGDMTIAAYDPGTGFGSSIDNADNAHTLDALHAAAFALAVHKPNHVVAGSDPFVAGDLLDATAKVKVLKAGALIGTRRGFNIIEGAGMTATMADDAANERVNITLASAAATTVIPSHQIKQVGGTYFLYDATGAEVTSDATPDINVLIQYMFDHVTLPWAVEVAAGNYVAQSAVSYLFASDAISQGFEIRGQGCDETTIQLTHNLTTSVDLWHFDSDEHWNCRFTIRDLGFDMNATTYTSRDCIDIQGGDRWRLQNVRIQSPYRDGIFIANYPNADDWYGVTYASIIGCTVKNYGRYGVYCGGKDLDIIDLVTETGGDTGLFINGGSVFVWGAHCTYAHYPNGVRDYGNGSTKDQKNYPGAGDPAGQDHYCGIELGEKSGGCLIEGMWADRCKQGVYVNSFNNSVSGKMYQTNYGGIDGTGYDMILTAVADNNVFPWLYCRGQSSHRTIHPVYITNGATGNKFGLITCGTSGYHFHNDLIENAGDATNVQVDTTAIP